MRRGATSAGARAAASSSRERSTISTMRASTASRSPGCTKRCATVPLIGAVTTASRTCLRASSAAAWAAACEAVAAARLESEVSSAFLLMNPWATSARLLASVRAAMSSCACAAATWSSAWRSRQPASVSSSSAMRWPARTVSPSRTVRLRSSAASRALTMAVSTAARPPESSTVRTRSCVLARARSVAASSIAAGADAADAAAAADGAPPLPQPASRPAPRTTSRVGTAMKERVMRLGVGCHAGSGRSACPARSGGRARDHARGRRRRSGGAAP